MDKYLKEPFLKSRAEINLSKYFLTNERRFSSNVFDKLGLDDGRHNFAALAYSTINIGDEIQSIAQLGFLPKERSLSIINRDHLNHYNGLSAIAILNGWYLHNVTNWPPSPNIDPVFISFHLADTWRPNEQDLKYLRLHGPIGCRDTTTVERLGSYGVDAFFSGCLTLTLTNPIPPSERDGPVVICDADLGYDGGYPPSASSMFKRLIPREVLDDAVWVQQECQPRRRLDYVWKCQEADRRLELLARARLVITTRLHCALPCRALGVPVIMLHENYEEDSRFNGLREVLQGYGPDTKCIDIDWTKPGVVDVEPYRERVTDSLVTLLRARLK